MSSLTKINVAVFLFFAATTVYAKANSGRGGIPAALRESESGAPSSKVAGIELKPWPPSNKFCVYESLSFLNSKDTEKFLVLKGNCDTCSGTLSVNVADGYILYSRRRLVYECCS